MWVLVGPRSCLNAAGCCEASRDSAFDATSGPDHKHNFILKKKKKNDIDVCVCASLRECLPGYCEASRTKPPPGLLLSLRSPPTIKRRKRKGIDRECDGSKNSVTFITFHVSHHAVNAEQRAAREEGGRQRKREEEKWACPGTLLPAGQFGRAEVRYCYL